MRFLGPRRVLRPPQELRSRSKVRRCGRAWWSSVGAGWARRWSSGCWRRGGPGPTRWSWSRSSTGGGPSSRVPAAWPPGTPASPWRPMSVAADGAVVAVKPGDVEAACRAVAAAGVGRVLSIAAGVPLARLEDWLGGAAGGLPVVRAMPNTPALVGAGAAAIAAGPAGRRRRPGLGRGDPRRGRDRRAGPRAPARRRHRSVGLGPGVRVPGGRGPDRGRRPGRAAPPGQPGPRRADPARIGPAAGRVGRDPGVAAGRR